MVLVVVSSSVTSVVVSSSVLSILCRHNTNTCRDIADDITCCRCCHGWITKDELGIDGVGESWIESNQLYCINGGVVDIV